MQSLLKKPDKRVSRRKSPSETTDKIAKLIFVHSYTTTGHPVPKSNLFHPKKNCS
jgi:hypothetical protein